MTLLNENQSVFSYICLKKAVNSLGHPSGNPPLFIEEMKARSDMMGEGKFRRKYLKELSTQSVVVLGTPVKYLQLCRGSETRYFNGG